MALTEAEDEWLLVLLENLEERRALLYPKAQAFLDDQISRHSQYGTRMLLSPKQKQWLTDLHKEYCPDAELPDPNPEVQLSEPDDEPEIPF